jgi:hypothetical protein
LPSKKELIEDFQHFIKQAEDLEWFRVIYQLRP